MPTPKCIDCIGGKTISRRRDPRCKSHAIETYQTGGCSNPDKPVRGLGNDRRRSVKDSVPDSPSSMAILGEERVRIHGPGGSRQEQCEKANTQHAREQVTGSREQQNRPGATRNTFTHRLVPPVGQKNGSTRNAEEKRPKIVSAENRNGVHRPCCRQAEQGYFTSLLSSLLQRMFLDTPVRSQYTQTRQNACLNCDHCSPERTWVTLQFSAISNRSSYEINPVPWFRWLKPRY